MVLTEEAWQELKEKKTKETAAVKKEIEELTKSSKPLTVEKENKIKLLVGKVIATEEFLNEIEKFYMVEEVQDEAEAPSRVQEAVETTQDSTEAPPGVQEAAEAAEPVKDEPKDETFIEEVVETTKEKNLYQLSEEEINVLFSDEIISSRYYLKLTEASNSLYLTEKLMFTLEKSKAKSFKTEEEAEVFKELLNFNLSIVV